MDYKIGADPEVVLVDEDGSPLSADDYLSYETQGIGTDGCGETAEIRPKPSNSILAVVASIRMLMQDFRAETKFDFVSGALYDGQTLGGHVHFGYVEPTSGCNCNTATPIIMNDAVREIDKVYFPWEEGIANKNEIKRREDRGYGGRNAWKAQPHGFEYRTPFSWLYNPTMAVAAIGLCEIGFFNFLAGKHLRNYLTTRDILDDVSKGTLLLPEKEEMSIVVECIIKSMEYKSIDFNKPIIRNWLNG